MYLRIRDCYSLGLQWCEIIPETGVIPPTVWQFKEGIGEWMQPLKVGRLHRFTNSILPPFGMGSTNLSYPYCKRVKGRYPLLVGEAPNL